jgi:hypothetical protein
MDVVIVLLSFLVMLLLYCRFQPHARIVAMLPTDDPSVYPLFVLTTSLPPRPHISYSSSSLLPLL